MTNQIGQLLCLYAVLSSTALVTIFRRQLSFRYKLLIIHVSLTSCFVVLFSQKNSFISDLIFCIVFSCFVFSVCVCISSVQDWTWNLLRYEIC